MIDIEENHERYIAILTTTYNMEKINNIYEDH